MRTSIHRTQRNQTQRSATSWCENQSASIFTESQNTLWRHVWQSVPDCFSWERTLSWTNTEWSWHHLPRVSMCQNCIYQVSIVRKNPTNINTRCPDVLDQLLETSYHTSRLETSTYWNFSVDIHIKKQKINELTQMSIKLLFSFSRGQSLIYPPLKKESDDLSIYLSRARSHSRVSEISKFWASFSLLRQDYDICLAFLGTK